MSEVKKDLTEIKRNAFILRGGKKSKIYVIFK